MIEFKKNAIASDEIRTETTADNVRVYAPNVDKSSYPKSYRAKNYTIKDFDTKQIVEQGSYIIVCLTPDNVNKGKNETGINRIQKFIQFSEQAIAKEIRK